LCGRDSTHKDDEVNPTQYIQNTTAQRRDPTKTRQLNLIRGDNDTHTLELSDEIR